MEDEKLRAYCKRAVKPQLDADGGEELTTYTRILQGPNKRGARVAVSGLTHGQDPLDLERRILEVSEGLDPGDGKVYADAMVRGETRSYDTVALGLPPAREEEEAATSGRRSDLAVAIDALVSVTQDATSRARAADDRAEAAQTRAADLVKDVWRERVRVVEERHKRQLEEGPPREFALELAKGFLESPVGQIVAARLMGQPAQIVQQPAAPEEEPAQEPEDPREVAAEAAAFLDEVLRSDPDLMAAHPDLVAQLAALRG